MQVVYLKMLCSDRILALLSLKKLFLVNLKKMCLDYIAPFGGPPNRPPLIDWQMVNIKVSWFCHFTSVVVLQLDIVIVLNTFCSL